ncbi:beta/gamma crystallin-related protein [Piscinibacter koreensis]|uniref:Beta/gamma crystallin family protein n=1 Tax=Piscinibacter koreensis TaxID=2742824 RepID=A0A7Y6NML7_9BURK|nr:beta/gamma crystallin-related protein [Schlegelella koreensis]NUZ05986.1 beta/gamma crystallin family protein [Schlegelella koreensis]
MGSNLPRSFALGAALLLAGVAQAAEITLYEHDDFRGRQITLRDGMRDLQGSGMNDRASSVIVRSGRWELCSDSGFKGYCQLFDRGEYRSIDGRLNDRVSSAREVFDERGRDADRRGGRDFDQRGGRDDDGRWRDRGGRADDDRRGGFDRGDRGTIRLYSRSDFQGRDIELERDVADLGSRDFNDRASSLVVTGGRWEVCSDAEFRGTCTIYERGRYPSLGRLQNQLSSVRRLR